MKDDTELLRSYVREHSEEAFAELVRRHLDFVYSRAFHRVGRDVHLAQDVSQKVFSDLARKASTLMGHASLSGWLHVSTHLAAAEAVRKEQRRKMRETDAHTMEKILSPSATETEADWGRLRPLLDELILELKDEDREALALRFFEQRRFTEIGTTLRLTEEAARKRVERAVEKLRARLVERGVTSTAAAVTFALAEGAVSAAPAGLAIQITGAAVAQFAAAGAGTSLFVSIMNALTSKVVAIGAGSLVVAAGLVWQQRVQAGLRAEIASLEGQGEAIRVLREDNQRLARIANETDDLRRVVAVRPAPLPEAPPVVQPASVASVAPQLNLTVTARGLIMWEGEAVSLDRFRQRLRDFRALNSGVDPQISVRGEDGATFDQLAFVTDEARKVEIRDVTVEANAKPATERTGFGPDFPTSPNPRAQP